MRQTSLILLAASTAALSISAQQSQPQRLTVVLDAARGGSEYGARIDQHTYEKQLTLDLANRLRSLLIARGFNVVLTRDSDTLVTNEQRAAIANGSKPIACILLHATAAGSGLHLWTSSETAMPVGSTAVLWDQAQAPFVDRSERLASEFAAAFSRSRIAVSSGHTWLRPLDNMQCPAIALEIAPEDADTSAADRAYQAHIAEAIAGQLLFWQSHTDVVDSILNPPPPPPAPARPIASDKPTGAATTPARTRVTGSGSPATPAATVSAPRPPAAAPNGSPAATSQPATPRPTAPRPATPQPRPAAPATESQPQ